MLELKKRTRYFPSSFYLFFVTSTGTGTGSLCPERIKTTSAIADTISLIFSFINFKYTHQPFLT